MILFFEIIIRRQARKVKGKSKMQSQITSTFMEIFDNTKKCFIDEYGRCKSCIAICPEQKESVFTQDFHNTLMAKMTSVEGLTVVSDDFEDHEAVRFNYRNCEVIMDYNFDNWGINWVTFTKLSFKGDTRDFYDD